ncbi:MAG: hypothetical protein HY720_24905 [Planctomycetes bacterium]|nr:hypothetical protein [Planctomycetota bacterium]
MRFPHPPHSPHALALTGLTFLVTLFLRPCSAQAPAADYLVLAPDEWMTEAQEIADLEASAGNDAAVLLLSAIHPSGKPTADQIRGFLAQSHGDHDFRYVLLLGKTDRIPMPCPMESRFGWRNAVPSNGVAGKAKDAKTLWAEAREAGKIHLPSKAYYNHFGMKVQGYIYIAQTGDYCFELAGDDAARLVIDGTLVAQADTWEKPAHGSLLLAKGWHSLSVDHIEIDGVARLSVKWRKPGSNKHLEVGSSAFGCWVVTKQGKKEWKAGFLKASYVQFQPGVTALSQFNDAIKAAGGPTETQLVGSLEFGPVRDMPSDLHYSDLNGDLVPECAAGRIPADNGAEALTVFKKGFGQSLLADGKLLTQVFSDKEFTGWTGDLGGIAGPACDFQDWKATGSRSHILAALSNPATDVLLYNGHGLQKVWSWGLEPTGAAAIMAGDKFALEIEGFILVDKAGSFELRLTSDDGAVAYVDGKLVLDNYKGGSHGPESVKATLDLAAGAHPIKILYQEVEGGTLLRLERKIGDSWVVMDGLSPDFRLVHFPVGAPVPGLVAHVRPGGKVVATASGSANGPTTVGYGIEGDETTAFTGMAEYAELLDSDSLTAEDASAMKNAHHPVVLAFACGTVWSTVLDNMGFQFLENPLGGAAVYVGSTEINLASTSEALAKAIYAELANDLASGAKRGFGEIVVAAELKVLANQGYESRVGAYTYLGDPAYRVE